MPELPEVETTRRGIEPLVVGRRVAALEVREPRLRWRVPRTLARRLEGRRIVAVGRRGKYLLLDTGEGALLVHLGMSGSLRYLEQPAPPGPHDHVDLLLEGGGCLRLNDPRRFGSVHFARVPERHPLIAHLGPEPLGDAFTGEYLWRASRGRRVAVKHYLMNSRVVAGLGNIYVNEALYRAGIHPGRAAGRIARPRYELLAAAVREVLEEALAQGGTTLRDFVGSDGRPGYFQLALHVYDRMGEPCPRCGQGIRRSVQGQRSTYYCARCQR